MRRQQAVRIAEFAASREDALTRNSDIPALARCIAHWRERCRCSSAIQVWCQQQQHVICAQASQKTGAGPFFSPGLRWSHAAHEAPWF